ncbi:MAG: hypothetical protein HY235_23925 [Acidobacteria bacterium]|nr:hypothetical protein [Acidobacteriota bacterium]
MSISMRLEDFSSGGVAPDGDYKITEASVVMWDYNGKMPTAICAVKIGVTSLNGEGEYEQYYSVGDGFVPGKSGKGIEADPKGGKTSLNKSTNYFLWLDSLVKAGFPPDKLGTETTVFEGIEARFHSVPAPVRPGMAARTSLVPQQGPERERTIFLVSNVLTLPWEEGGRHPRRGQGRRTGASSASSAVALLPPETLLERAKATDSRKKRRNFGGSSAEQQELATAYLTSRIRTSAMAKALGLSRVASINWFLAVVRDMVADGRLRIDDQTLQV